MKHEHTHHVAADADKVYAALADIRNLPHYVPQMTKAEPHDGDKVTVEATLEAEGRVCATCTGVFVAVKEGHPAYHRW